MANIKHLVISGEQYEFNPKFIQDKSGSPKDYDGVMEDAHKVALSNAEKYYILSLFKETAYSSTTAKDFYDKLYTLWKDSIPVVVTGITLNKNSISIVAGKSETIIATIEPENADSTIKWAVTPNNIVKIATISNNTISITGQVAGECTITATCESYSAICAVIVAEAEAELLYNLDSPEVFDSSNGHVVDTGIKLFENATSKPTYTILYDLTIGDLNYDNMPTIFHCMNESDPWPGITMDARGNGSGLNNIKRLQVAMYGSKAVVKLNPSNGRAVGSIIINKGMMYIDPIIAVSSNEYESTSPITISKYDSNISQTLILGGYRDTSGNTGRYFDGTINRFKVYDGVLDQNSIDEFCKIEEDEYTPIYTLENTYFNGTDDQIIDTGIKMFENRESSVYTILLDVTADADIDQTNRDKYAVLHCMEESNPWPGLSIAVWPKGSINYAKYGVNLYNNAITVYENIASIERKIAIIVNNGIYTIYSANNSEGISANIDGYTSNVDKSLLVGGYQTSDGTHGRFFKGTINNLNIYDKVINYTAIDKFING